MMQINNLFYDDRAEPKRNVVAVLAPDNPPVSWLAELFDLFGGYARTIVLNLKNEIRASFEQSYADLGLCIATRVFQSISDKAPYQLRISRHGGFRLRHLKLELPFDPG